MWPGCSEQSESSKGETQADDVTCDMWKHKDKNGMLCAPFYEDFKWILIQTERKHKKNILKLLLIFL